MSNKIPTARDLIEELVQENSGLKEALANADEAIEELCEEANALERQLVIKQDELDYQSEQIEEMLSGGEDSLYTYGIPVDVYMNAETVIADDKILRDTIGLQEKCRDLTEFKVRADIVIRDGVPIRIVY